MEQCLDKSLDVFWRKTEGIIGEIAGGNLGRILKKDYGQSHKKCRNCWNIPKRNPRINLWSSLQNLWRNFWSKPWKKNLRNFWRNFWSRPFRNSLYNPSKNAKNDQKNSWKNSWRNLKKKTTGRRRRNLCKNALLYIISEKKI